MVLVVMFGPVIVGSSLGGPAETCFYDSTSKKWIGVVTAARERRCR